MNVPVTLLYGGLTALLVTLLGVNVSLRRLMWKVPSGQPVPAELHRHWRAHGNAAEWIPLGLILLLVLELSGRIPRFPLHLLGGTLFLGRTFHAAGFLTRWPLRAAGAGITYAVLLVMAVLAVQFRFTM
jgi:uncharacterized membrane protein YecN with MAPEG domain